MERCVIEGCKRKPFKGKSLCHVHLVKHFETKPCKVEGCDKPHSAKGYCNMHYMRMRSNSTIEVKKKTENPEFCTVEGCDKLYSAKGYCSMHYSRFVRYGTTEKQQIIRKKTICKTEGCDNVIIARKLCMKCYQRELRLKRFYEREIIVPEPEPDPEPEPKSELFNDPDGEHCIVKDCNEYPFDGKFCFIHFFVHDGTEKGLIEARKLIR